MASHRTLTTHKASRGQTTNNRLNARTTQTHANSWRSWDESQRPDAGASLLIWTCDTAGDSGDASPQKEWLLHIHLLWRRQLWLVFDTYGWNQNSSAAWMMILMKFDSCDFNDDFNMQQMVVSCPKAAAVDTFDPSSSRQLATFDGCCSDQMCWRLEEIYRKTMKAAERFQHVSVFSMKDFSMKDSSMSRRASRHILKYGKPPA